jgi:xanthine dehydrogenase small subunit
LGRRRELRGIKVEKGICRLGAGVTFEEIHRSPELSRSFPGFSRAFRRVASTIVRHRATLGGNIVNASPIADAVIMLLALDAEVLLEKERRQRRIPLREFYLGYKQTALREGELVREVSFALPGRDDYFNFEKVSQREHLDIAAVNSALWLRLDKGVIRDVRLSAGGVAPVPLFLEGVSASLKGQRLEEEAVFQAARSVGREISPISDVRGSARYKKLLLEKLILGHFQELGFIGK